MQLLFADILLIQIFLCSAMSKGSICRTIQVLQMKTTRVNMVDTLMTRDKDLVAEDVDLVADHPGALGEGEGICMSALCVNFRFIFS